MAQQDDTLRVALYQGTIRIGDEIVALSSVARVTSRTVEQPFPQNAVYMLLAGIALMVLCSGIQALLLVGVVLVAVGALLLLAWYSAHKSAPRGVFLNLSSGTTVSICFEDHEAARKLAASIGKALDDGYGNGQIFNLKNAEIKNSQIGGIGNGMLNGRG